MLKSSIFNVPDKVTICPLFIYSIGKEFVTPFILIVAIPLLCSVTSSFPDNNSVLSITPKKNFGTKKIYENVEHHTIKFGNKYKEHLDDIFEKDLGDAQLVEERKIEEDNSIKDIEQFKNKNGARFKINETWYESNYDGSQDEDEKANNDVLETFFKPFENNTNYSKAEEGRIIAINEGRLVEFLSTSSKYNQLTETIEEFFYKEGHHNLPDGLMIINLNLRSIVAQD